MYIFAPGILIAKRTKYLIWINVFSALLNSVLNYILIPLMGIVGAALATMLSYLCVFIVYMVISQQLYTVPHRWRSIFASVLVAGFLALCLPILPLMEGQRLVLNLLALSVFMVSSVPLGLIRIDELRQCKAFLKSWLYRCSPKASS